MENSESGKSPLYRLGLFIAFIGMIAGSIGTGMVGSALSQMRSIRQGTEAPVPNVARQDVPQLKLSQDKMPARKKPVQTYGERQSAIMPEDSTKPVNYPYQGDKRFPSRPLASQARLPARQGTGERANLR